jgi:NADH dehydrogenase
MSTEPAERHRVVVIGGGFGGLPPTRFLARRRAARRGIEVTLIDRRNHHLFQPLLYQVATGLIPPGQIAPALRHVVRRHDNVRVECAEVTGFDLDQHIVHAHVLGLQAREVPYDTLIVAAGVNQSYFGHDEYALYAPGMKTIDDALELRRRIFGAFEMAEVIADPAERERWLTVAIVGAGPTGVELAGQVRELAVRSLRREFRSFEASSVRVVLLDGGKEPLATFGEQLSGKAARALERLGIELRMGARVVGVDASGVDISEAGTTSRLDTYTTIWAAGVEASPLAAELAKATGAELDRAGRIAVLPDLTLPGHPEIFVVGDMMALDKLPGVAEVAMQGGLHAANTIVRRLKDKPGVPFKYRDLGSAATIGRFNSVVDFHGIRLSGFPGWVIWALVHLTFLTGFGNRLSTLLKWTRSFIGRGRPEREFSVMHTGGDLSLPAEVRAVVQPNPLPVARQALFAPQDEPLEQPGAG